MSCARARKRARSEGIPEQRFDNMQVTLRRAFRPFGNSFEIADDANAIACGRQRGENGAQHDQNRFMARVS